MARRQDARAALLEEIRTSPRKFVRVVGVPYLIEREKVDDPSREDHVWITLEVPPFGSVRAVVNTLSLLNARAGFDPRMRLGIVRSTWSVKPPPELAEDTGLDYARIEAEANVFYERFEHEALVALLVERGKRVIRVEVWGELYGRDHLGLHQIHCRRASSAVPLDVRNRDGALKFYYPKENLAEMFLFKFSGQ